MSKLRVLIVEDEPAIAEHIAAYLDNTDFEVSATTLEPGKKEPPFSFSGQEELIIVKDGLLKITLSGVSKI